MLNSPFAQAGSTRAVGKTLLKGSKFSFNGIVTNLEKTVSTINQVVPLYNQIKPLISNSKTILNAFKSTRNSKSDNKKSSRQNRYKQSYNPNIINVEAKETNTFQKTNEQKKDLYDVFTNVNTPNKPFFN